MISISSPFFKKVNLANIRKGYKDLFFTKAKFILGDAPLPIEATINLSNKWIGDDIMILMMDVGL